MSPILFVSYTANIYFFCMQVCNHNMSISSSKINKKDFIGILFLRKNSCNCRSTRISITQGVSCTPSTHPGALSTLSCKYYLWPCAPPGYPTTPTKFGKWFSGVLWKFMMHMWVKNKILNGYAYHWYKYKITFKTCKLHFIELVLSRLIINIILHIFYI